MHKAYKSNHKWGYPLPLATDSRRKQEGLKTTPLRCYTSPNNRFFLRYSPGALGLGWGAWPDRTPEICLPWKGRASAPPSQSCRADIAARSCEFVRAATVSAAEGRQEMLWLCPLMVRGINWKPPLERRTLQSFSEYFHAGVVLVHGLLVGFPSSILRLVGGISERTPLS